MFRTLAIFVLTSTRCRCLDTVVATTSHHSPTPFRPANVSATTAADPVELPGVWAADMFYEALANFTVREDAGPTSDACRKQTRMYARHLKIGSYWAVKSKSAR